MNPGRRRQVDLCVHPPERRRPRGLSGVAAYAGCCCCCCCCLHVLGGLVGAATASVKGKPTPQKRLANKSYWLSFLALTLLNFFLPWGTAFDGPGWHLGFNILFVLLGVLPGIQLAAAAVACVAIALSSQEDKPAAYRHVGRVALYTFLGAAVGAGLVLAFFGLVK